jgi:hypothetical protein
MNGHDRFRLEKNTGVFFDQTRVMNGHVRFRLEKNTGVFFDQTRVMNGHDRFRPEKTAKNPEGFFSSSRFEDFPAENLLFLKVLMNLSDSDEPLGTRECSSTRKKG